MKILTDALEAWEGFAARRELEAFGVDRGLIALATYYGRDLIRVRSGWYTSPDEDPEVIRAWRVGGRLTCVSALAFHTGEKVPPVLHVEVPARTGRMRNPDNPRLTLNRDTAPVVIHWTRYPGPGHRRSVSLEHALAVAGVCGVHGAGVPRPGQAT